MEKRSEKKKKNNFNGKPPFNFDNKDRLTSIDTHVGQ